MDKKNVVIVVIAILLLVSFFYVGYLKNKRVNAYERSTNKYNELLREKEEFEECVLDGLMYFETCVLNCNDYKCLHKKCNINSVYKSWLPC